MADDRLPFLRDRISGDASYVSPQGGAGPRLVLPPRDPKAHRRQLLSQLDVVAAEAKSRPPDARDQGASRELIAVVPAANATLDPGGLMEKGVWVVGQDPDTGVVVLDAPSPDLVGLRKKIDFFADDTKVKQKTDAAGNVTTTRARQNAVAPIEALRLAAVEDRSGVSVRSDGADAARRYWFEVGCRGGYRRPPAIGKNSRDQILRQMHRLGFLDPEKLPEAYEAAELLYFFIRLMPAQLSALAKATDCIYEVNLAPPALRDHFLFEDTKLDLRSFELHPPPANAPSVVVLDSGIASRHPLLSAALLPGVHVPHLSSSEDRHGHGTKMAGLALYRDVGAAVEAGGAQANHWIQSARLIDEPGIGHAGDEYAAAWPLYTAQAVEAAEAADTHERKRVFSIATTRSMQVAPTIEVRSATVWSLAIDQLAFGFGGERLLVAAAGNARYEQWLALAEQHPQLQLTEKVHDPAQAANALTVGAYTIRTELPPDPSHQTYSVVATTKGGASPFTSCGVSEPQWPLKPDIVMEGGNLAIAPGPLPNPTIPTLSGLSTSAKFAQGEPLGLLSMTSEATARASRLAAEVWSVEKDLRPATVRGLLVHAASWTEEMRRQFPTATDRFAAFGYGVPDEVVARDCAAGRATIIIEDEMPGAVIERVPKKKAPKRPNTSRTEPKRVRKLKLYRLPVPDNLADEQVELRVTLSYLPEPNQYRRRTMYGLDLKWDMQGPHETEPQFLTRINKVPRPVDASGKSARPAVKTRSFDWDVKSQLRGRGTVQSDRWIGRGADLAGDKLIAIMPVLGWWEQRAPLQDQTMKFSLIITVRAIGIYAAIEQRIGVPLEV